MKSSVTLTALAGLAVGVVLGGYLFSDTKPRSLLAVNRCQDCMKPNELLGLIAAVGIQDTPGLMPGVVFETDKTIVIRHPFPEAPIHLVIIPKKDIKNIGDLGGDDIATLADMMAVVQKLVADRNLTRYRLWTNGPGHQVVAYLHFHLTSD